jgi:hypothetical protein
MFARSWNTNANSKHSTQGQPLRREVGLVFFISYQNKGVKRCSIRTGAIGGRFNEGSI